MLTAAMLRLWKPNQSRISAHSWLVKVLKRFKTATDESSSQRHSSSAVVCETIAIHKHASHGDHRCIGGHAGVRICDFGRRCFPTPERGQSHTLYRAHRSPYLVLKRGRSR